jgi:hypothetical protein
MSAVVLGNRGDCRGRQAARRAVQQFEIRLADLRLHLGSTLLIGKPVVGHRRQRLYDFMEFTGLACVAVRARLQISGEGAATGFERAREVRGKCFWIEAFRRSGFSSFAAYKNVTHRSVLNSRLDAIISSIMA